MKEYPIADEDGVVRGSCESDEVFELHRLGFGSEPPRRERRRRDRLCRHRPRDSNFGATDPFGTPKLGGVDLVADELAAGNALLSGQAAERLPVVLVHRLDYDPDDGIGPDAELVRSGFWPTLKRSVLVKTVEHVPVSLP